LPEGDRLLENRDARLAQERTILERLCLGGDEDEALEHTGMVALHRLVELLPVHFGHPHVAEHQVEGVAAQQFEALTPTRCGLNLVPSEAERVGDSVANVPLIVDHQHARPGHTSGKQGMCRSTARGSPCLAGFLARRRAEAPSGREGTSASFCPTRGEPR
jgi:hypothetical protein